MFGGLGRTQFYKLDQQKHSQRDKFHSHDKFDVEIRQIFQLRSRPEFRFEQLRCFQI